MRWVTGSAFARVHVSRLITCGFVLAAILTSAQVAMAGTPPDSADELSEGSLPLDLQGDPARIRHYVKDLLDPSQVVWREAQIRLAAAGAPALEAIERARVADRDSGRARVLAVVSLALLTTVTPPDLAAHPRLQALAEPEIERGRVLADSLAGRSTFDLGEGGFVLEDTPPTDVQRILMTLHRLRGLAMPAALELTRDARPVARAYGGYLVRRYRTGAEAVRRLGTDLTPITIVGSDWVETGTVAEAVGPRFGSRGGAKDPGTAFDEMVTLLFADEDMSDLINGIRQTSSSPLAESWDDWWNGARPAWNEWWKLAGTGRRPPDREEWLNFQREREGFRLWRHDDPRGASKLSISGPPGTQCTVFRDSVKVAEGPLPLRIESDPEPPPADGRPIIDSGSLRIRAVFASGRVWDKTFVSNRGQDWTIVLLE